MVLTPYIVLEHWLLFPFSMFDVPVIRTVMTSRSYSPAGKLCYLAVHYYRHAEMLTTRSTNLIEWKQ